LLGFFVVANLAIAFTQARLLTAMNLKWIEFGGREK